MDDAPARVPALEPEREVARAVRVELHAELLEVVDAGGRVLAQHPHRARTGQLAPRAERVLDVQLGRVVLGERGGDPALGPEAGGLRERRAAHERDPRSLARGHERGVEAGGAGAHDCDIGADGLLHGAQVPYRRPCPSTCAIPPRSSTTPVPVHPERVDRIRAIEAVLERRCSASPAEPGFATALGWDVARGAAGDGGAAAARAPAARTSSGSAEMSARGAAFDLDTPTSPGSFEAASRAAGGACALAEALLEGGERTGFSVLRPPGHHAEPERAMGFCLFATVAIAARHALDALGAERVLVLDWDVHHGNGTNTIFHDSPEVLFASIHQYPFWPGSGALGDVGSGAGEGYSLNLPVPAGTGEAAFLSLVEHVVAPAARQFGPDLILVSAGFDAHRDDPLGGLALETESFGALARQVRALGDELGAPVGAVLEGGYDLRALAESVAETMEALAGDEPPAAVAAAPAGRGGREVLGRYWDL